VTVDDDGRLLEHHEVLRNVVEEAKLADRLGIDFFGVGEHHREDFAVTAPEVVLAAIASETKNIRIGSAVTVLSSDDPVRVYQRFATLDAISEGRAEVILGRGSFTESFPLFGYALNEYGRLFEEKASLFTELRNEEAITWRGTTRPPLTNQMVYPKTEDGSIVTWIGVGGSPDSVIRAARNSARLMLAIIGGQPSRFAPLVELYFKTLDEMGQDRLPVGVHSPGHVADSDEQAIEEVWPHHQALFSKIGKERGWPPMSRAQFEHGVGPDGALYVGSPETVARKIIKNSKLLNLSRFDMKYSNGTLPHPKLMKSIELYATKVAPLVLEAMR
jgi:probable LLM family oxidoreductase